MKDISKGLRKALDRQGMCQKDLALAAGITPCSVSVYLSGKRKPNAYTLSRICDVLRCSPDYLYNAREDISYAGVIEYLEANGEYLTDDERAELVLAIFNKRGDYNGIKTDNPQRGR